MPWSSVNTESSISRVQHPPSTAYSKYSIHLRLYVIPSFSRFHKSFKGKVTSSHSHGFELTNRWVESQHLVRLPLTASRSTTSKYFSNLPRSSPAASASLNSLDHSAECISKFTQFWPPSACPNSLDYGLAVHLWVHSISVSRCISEFTQSRPPSASLSSLNLGLQVHLWVHSISASKCISQLARSQPRSVSLSSLYQHLQAHLELLSITVCCHSSYTVCR